MDSWASFRTERSRLAVTSAGLPRPWTTRLRPPGRAARRPVEGTLPSSPPTSDRHGAWLALLLALAWGLLPALPALTRGELLGQPWTDLYPSVWGLAGFARSGELLPVHTELLGFPEGMGFYYSSPLKGTLARLLLPLLGLVGTWNALLVAARVGTVLAAWGAGRAWGLSSAGALVVAGAWGCAPFFQGYAVEGIVEGTDGWSLALWAWALGRGRPLLAMACMSLTLLSSWYLGAAGLLLAALATPWRPGAALSLLAPGLVLPALLAFGGAFPGLAPLADELRAAMGSPLPRAPGILPGIQPFALTAWVGLLLPLLALRQPLALLALIPALLSLGVGPWYELPGLELLRFPYRLHAATLAILALAAGRSVDGLAQGGPGRRRLVPVLGFLIAAEGLLLSPIEPVLPGAPAEIPAIYAQVDGPLVEVPGPVAMAPGRVNHSRPRARYLLYAQVQHGQPSPWVPDFNGVGVTTEPIPELAALAAWDPLVQAAAPADLAPGTVAGLRDRGLRLLMLHEEELGARRSRALADALLAQGARLLADDGRRRLFALTP